jgi:hypothetical protein
MHKLEDMHGSFAFTELDDFSKTVEEGWDHPNPGQPPLHAQ